MCGTVGFSGYPIRDSGVNITLTFDFDPTACGKSCTCNEVAFVQMIRVIDQDSGAFLAPNGEFRDRLVAGQADPNLNGWAVDRGSGWKWGYYGRRDDGTFIASRVTPGSNTNPATLKDEPKAWPVNTSFHAVDAPVCIDGDAACNDCLFGFYNWLFFVDSGGDASEPVGFPAPEWTPTAAQLAVAEWNNDASSLAKHSFPTLTLP
jgi:hypothetical protein